MASVAREQSIADFRALCASLEPMPDDASHVQERLINAMVAAGYRVFHEYFVELPTGRSGRIDIVAKDKAGRWLAIEIDARKPRKRSIEKLSLRNWIRVSCLRGVAEGIDEYPGLDAVIALPVRLASFPEKAKKANVAYAGWKARHGK
jgi:hypothetical protein